MSPIHIPELHSKQSVSRMYQIKHNDRSIILLWSWQYVFDFIVISETDYSQFNTLKGCKTDNWTLSWQNKIVNNPHYTFYKTTSLLFCKPISENDINKMISKIQQNQKRKKKRRVYLEKELPLKSYATSIWRYNTYILCVWCAM